MYICSKISVKIVKKFSPQKSQAQIICILPFARLQDHVFIMIKPVSIDSCCEASVCNKEQSFFQWQLMLVSGVISL